MPQSQPNGPQHPIVEQMSDNWHKIAAAIMMSKLKTDHVVLTPKDLERLTDDRVVVLQELSDGLHIHYIPAPEAERMMRSHLN